VTYDIQTNRARYGNMCRNKRNRFRNRLIKQFCNICILRVIMALWTSGLLCWWSDNVDLINETFTWFFPHNNTIPSDVYWKHSSLQIIAVQAQHWRLTDIEALHKLMFYPQHLRGDYSYDSTVIRLRSDYDVSRAPASIRRDSTRAKN